MKYTIYVVTNGDETTRNKAQRVCSVRAARVNSSEQANIKMPLPRLLPPSKKQQYSVEYPPRVAALLTNYTKRADKTKTHEFEIVLLRHDFDGAFVQQCRDVAARVAFSTLISEMRRYGVEDTAAQLICDRMQPRERNDFLPSTRRWYAGIVAHIQAAKPNKLLVVAGRPGCGKSAMIGVAVRECVNVCPALFDITSESGSEAQMWRSAGAMAKRARRDKRTTLVVVDNADEMSEVEEAQKTFCAIAALATRVTTIVIVNNWYGRGVIGALRRHVEGKGAISKTLTVELLRCEPLPSESEVCDHLALCLPDSNKELRRVVASECGGDVRVAMQRLDIESRLAQATQKRGVTTKDAFARSSPATQLNEAVGEMARMQDDVTRAADTRMRDFYAPLERRVGTLDETNTAHELLFENYPRQLSLFVRSMIDELDMLCEASERISATDLMLTQERSSGMQGADESVPLIAGLGNACKALSRFPALNRFEMKFSRMNNVTAARNNAGAMLDLWTSARAGAQAIMARDTNECVRFLREGKEPRARRAAQLPICALETLSLLGYYVSKQTLTDRIMHVSCALERSVAVVKELQDLKTRGRPRMLEQYEREHAHLEAEHTRSALVIAAQPPNVYVSSLEAAALRCAAVGMNGEQFALVVQVADKLRFGGGAAKPPTKADLAQANRVARQSNQRELGKRRHVQVDAPIVRKRAKADASGAKRGEKDEKAAISDAVNE